jgi:hypothetical protein
MREQGAGTDQDSKEKLVHGVCFKCSAAIEALASIRASVKIVVSENS